MHDGAIHHAYLFFGPTHIGKRTLAIQLAQALNCDEPNVPCGNCGSCMRILKGTHPDVISISVNPEAEPPEPRTQIGIQAVRDTISSANLRPYEGRNRVFIVTEADLMNEAAQNACLKLLEEPPPNVVLVLLAPHPDAVLGTVKSRCQTIELRPLPLKQSIGILTENYGLSLEQAEALARLSEGRIGWAISAAQDPAIQAELHHQFERIVEVCDSNLVSRFAYAADLAQRFQRDRVAVQIILNLWIRWMRDLLLILSGQEQQITNTAWRITLRSHADTVQPIKVIQCIRAIAFTLEALERNANPRLALESFVFDIPLMKQSTPHRT